MMAEGRRSSILKPPKQRAPLQEVSSLNIHNHDEFTTTTFTQNIMRRVSFAGTSTVKEFDTRAESVLVCHTPAYEESFATSDSSVPSDHSSRFSSRSTLSIEDQSTLPSFSDGNGASVDPMDIQPEKAQCQNLDPDDLIMKEFGVEPLTQRTKSPPRRPRFSIAGPSDDESSPVTKEKPPPAPVPSSLFYGTASPRPRAGTIPAARSQRLTIDPFSLRPKAVSSPRSQTKRKSLASPAASPASKMSLSKAFLNADDSASSEMELTEAISGNIFVNTPSPSSVDTQGTPGSVFTPRISTDRPCVSNEDMELTRVEPRTPGWREQTLCDSDMDMTSAIPTRIHSGDEARVHFSDGQVHCSVQNSMRMEFTRPVTSVAITNEQHIVGDGYRGVAYTSESHVTALSVEAPVAKKDEVAPGLAVLMISDRPQRSKNFHDGEILKPSSSTICDETRTGLIGAQCSVPAMNKTLNTTVGMEFTKSLPSVPVTKSLPHMNRTVSDPENMEFTNDIPSVPVTRSLPPLNRTVCDPENMEFTNAIPSVPVTNSLPHLNRTVCDPENMEFTKAIPSVHVLGNAPFKPRWNVSVTDPGVTELSPVNPVSGKDFEPVDTNSINRTFNESMGMDFTEAIPFVPIVEGDCFLERDPAVRHEAKLSNRTLLESTGMDFTEAIPIAPIVQEFAAASNETMSDSIGMEFTKAVPTMPIVQETHVFPEGLCEPVPALPRTCDSNQNRADPNAAEFPTNRAITTAWDSPTMEYSRISQAPPLDSVNGSMSSQGTKTPDSVIFNSVADILRGDNRSKDASPVISLQLATNKFQQTKDIDSSKLRRSGGTEASASLPEVEPNTSRPCDSEHVVLLEPSGKLQETPLKQQLCRKSSHDEVGNTEEGEPSARRSRLMASPLVPAPTEIVIPSSRSPSPDEHDSSARFPGLYQSFSGTKLPKVPELDSQAMKDTLTDTVSESRGTPTLQANQQVTCTSVGEVVTSTNCSVELATSSMKDSAPTISEAALTIHEAAPTVSEAATINGTMSTMSDVAVTTSEAAASMDKVPPTMNEASPTVNEVPPTMNEVPPTMNEVPPTRNEVPPTMNEVPPTRNEVPPTMNEVPPTMNESTALISSEVRTVQTPDDCNVMDISVSTSSEKLLHKSLMDVSIPSMVDISDACAERDLSSDARLYATLLEAQHNVSVFHKEPELEVPLDESMRQEEEKRMEEKNMSVCEKQEDVVEEQREASGDGTVVPALDSRPLASLPSPFLIPNESPRERAYSSDTSAGISGRAFGVCRPLQEVFKEHRTQYRKRARCNWTVRKSGETEWCFNYLEDSVELRIKVKDSRSGTPSGRNGRFVSLITDDLHGVWYIGGRLLYQKLSIEEWTSRVQETPDVLSVVEDANIVANEVEVFMTHLAYLNLLKNAEITHDWVRFDVLSKKTTDRWFKVKVDCRDIPNIRPQHVTIENFIGETRETDVQNLVTCVKKNADFLKNYVGVVEEYLQIMERIG